MSPQFTTTLYNHLLVFLLLCVCLTYFSCHARSECVESEREALLEFKHGIRVDRCGQLDSWGVYRYCCQWHGIHCHNHSADHVIALRLPTPENYLDNNNGESCLEGTLGVSLLGLKHLKYLDLSYNRFGGQIPKFIGSLSNLEHLNLSNTGFTGTIPYEIGNLSKLISLDLNSNFDSSNTRVESLRWLMQLMLLRVVDLGGIDLSIATNSWLPIVNNLPFLQILRLDYCKLSLKLPSSLSYINSSTTFAIISLRGNNLNDTSVFKWLSELGGVTTNLIKLDVSENQQPFGSNFQQTGHVMDFLGNLCSLQTLRLDNTGLNYNFSDIIQSLVCSHKSLLSLDLSGNQVWGSITDNLGNFSNLRELTVDGNHLNGTISLGAFKGSPMLELLTLSSNSIKGVLTGAHLSNLPKLSRLDLSDNIELVVNISDNWVPPYQLDELSSSFCKVGPNFPI